MCVQIRIKFHDMQSRDLRDNLRFINTCPDRSPAIRSSISRTLTMARTLFVGLMALSLMCNYGFALPSGVPGHTKFDSCSIEDGVSQGDINGDDHLPEASGLAYSGRTDGVLWSLNDHEGEDRIFAISEQGERLLDLSMEDVKNEDWEDIAVVVEGGVSYIYLSDTGNNDFDNEDAR